jgi:hypothetical protein
VFSVKRNASQFAGAPGAVRRERFFRMCIKLASARVPLNGSVELCGVEDFKPRTKPRQLARGKLFDGFLDVFGGGHVKDIALGRDAAKGVERSYKTHAPSGT